MLRGFPYYICSTNWPLLSPAPKNSFPYYICTTNWPLLSPASKAISHDTTNHPAHQRHAAFTPACSALPTNTTPRKRTFHQGIDFRIRKSDSPTPNCEAVFLKATGYSRKIDFGPSKHEVSLAPATKSDRHARKCAPRHNESAVATCARRAHTDFASLRSRNAQLTISRQGRRTKKNMHTLRPNMHCFHSLLTSPYIWLLAFIREPQLAR